MSFVSVDLLALARDARYFSTHAATNIITPAISLLSFHPDFQTVLGENATARKIAELPWPAFHEAGVYNKGDNSLYLASNYQTYEDNINITVVSLDSLDDFSFASTQFPDLREANGGTSYYPPGADRSQTPPQHVYCDQGDFEHASKLVAVDPNTNTSTILLTSFMGRNFSSINDVRQHPVTGDLWFTDSDYGYFQAFRGPPSQPKHVYRFDPATGVIQAVADGFAEPNGLEFSPDGKTLYVTDSGAQKLYVTDSGAQTFGFDGTGPSTIYAFEVIRGRTLANRRTFAFADTGVPDGIHCDTQGNVWASAGDGVHVWNDEGVLLGKIFIGETSNNFAFAPGKVLVFANRRLWVVENVRAQGREVCKDFGVGC